MDGLFVFIGNPETWEIISVHISGMEELCDMVEEMGAVLDCARPLWASYDAKETPYDEAEIDFNNYFCREIYRLCFLMR